MPTLIKNRSAMFLRLKITTPDDLHDIRFCPYLLPFWLYTRVIIIDRGDRAWMFAFRLLPLIRWRYFLLDMFEPGVDASAWTGRHRQIMHWEWPWLFKSWRREIITGAWNETADAA